MAEWRIAAKRADFYGIARRYGIDPVIARVIRNRDIINDEDIDMYLNGTLDNLHDADLMTDMVKACSLIQQYISEDLSFRIIGDYDVDGVCATYILLRGLAACGADVDYAIPHRIHDGYGINEQLIDAAQEEFVDVIITCDNGIAASAQIEHANELGMHVIVTDHHEVPYETDEEGNKIELLPPAEAVIDPHRDGDKYPYNGICGAVVAWKLVGILLNMCGINKADADRLMLELLEEASLATICDVMQLENENRIIVREGLRRLTGTSNPGLRALINANGLSGRKITVYSCGFVIGPCLNAAGRLDSASKSLELLLSTDEYTAARIAGELKNYNDERKSMTESGCERAIYDIDNSVLKDDKVLVVYLPNVHESVAGLIAGRIRERYERPVIVFTDGEEGIKGSGRSIEAYNMYEELAAFKDMYAKFGGHKMAAGLTLAGDDVDELRDCLNNACTLTDDDLKVITMIDSELPFDYVTYDLIDQLELIEPCGNGNKKPVFALRNLTVDRLEDKKSERAPYMIQITDNKGGRYKLKMFDREGIFLSGADAFYGEGTGEKMLAGNCRGVTIDVIYTPGINEYRDMRNIEFMVNDYRFK